MRKKLKEYSVRFLSVFLVCFILFSFSIPFAHASQVDYDIGLINLFDLQTNYPTIVRDGNLYKTRFDFPSGYKNYHYFEFYYYCADANHTASIYRYDSFLANCTIVPCGNAYYKAYWSGGQGSSYINFVINSSTSAFSLASAYYSDVPVTLTNIPFEVYSFNLGDINYSDTGTSTFHGSYAAGATANLIESTTAVSQYINFDHTVFISKENWAKFDYITLHYDLRRYSLGAVNVKIGDVSVPYSLSYNDSIEYIPENSVAQHSSNSQLNILIDLSDIPLTYNNSLAINVTGTYFNSSYDDKVFASIYGVSGFNNANEVNYDVVWYRRIFLLLENWLSVISSKLDIIVGGDSAASDARQTQEDINVSVNNQLVGAVEDWNTNIEVVETGYDLAVTKTTPSLVWLSSLADGIFNGMGWFGNVYFLVGLISVLMLLLSKSGLASKIGSISRRRGD